MFTRNSTIFPFVILSMLWRLRMSYVAPVPFRSLLIEFHNMSERTTARNTRSSEGNFALSTITMDMLLSNYRAVVTTFVGHSAFEIPEGRWSKRLSKRVLRR